MTPDNMQHLELNPHHNISVDHTESDAPLSSYNTVSSNDTPDIISQISRIIMVIFCLGLLVVLGRVVQLQLYPLKILLEHTPQTSSVRSMIARRGDLMDRRGRVLATSSIGYKLFVDPQSAKDPGALAADLGYLLDINPITLDTIIQKRLDKQYVPLIPLLTDAQVEIIKAANISGVGLEKILVRHKTYNDLAAAFIGQMSTDQIGLSGAECRFNDLLDGKYGKIRYLRDSGRRALWVQPEDYSVPLQGQNVRLSIDIEIQSIAKNELTSQVKAMNAGGGCLVVLDPQSGEILAVCDVINNPREGFEPYAVDPARDLNPSLGRVRCATDMYEPGSTFKPYIWAAALDLGIVKADEVFNAYHGLYLSGRRRIHDAHPYDELTWEMVLVKSSNIGMVQAAERMTHQQMQQAITNFGFGYATESGILGDSSGKVTSPEKWTNYTQSSVSFGQEIAVTPLQMVRAFSAFATDGTLPQLRITANDPIRSEIWEGGKTKPTRATLQQRAIPESIALQTRYVLRRVMLEGTGRAANQNAQYRMFGKSGTTQMPNRKNGGYYDDRYVASFIAGAPLDDPRLVVLCVIEDPDKRIGHYGGAISGPVVCNVINQTLQYLGVPSDLYLDKNSS